MTDHPILFSGPMVRAILDGRKTMTRRLVKRELAPDPGHDWAECLCREIDPSDTPCLTCAARFGPCPYGVPGDHLWIREAWAQVHPCQVGEGRFSLPGQAGIPGPPRAQYHVVYRADGPYPPCHRIGAPPWRAPGPAEPWDVESNFTGWTPSIHMPRWASRLTLEVTAVRVERLQDITEEDARAEGLEPVPAHGKWAGPRETGGHWSARKAFADTWDGIHGADAWEANPWVWCISFRRLEATP